MKKGVVIAGLILLILILPHVFADDNSTINMTGVDKAYNCLTQKIGDCASLSTEEKIFSLLAIGKCKDQLISDSSNDGTCFPSSGCKVKTTAQAILALDKAGANTQNAEDWLISQNSTPSDVVWYLQVDSPEATTCTISYSGSTYSVVLGENKKFTAGAGCFSLAQGGYWLEISPSCYGQNFEISCDKQFLTSLLFKKKDSPKIYVSDNTNAASAEGTTNEKVNSYCFGQGGSCDYEGSLWATLILNHLGYDTSPYMPYLITMTEANPQYLPESFLYLLTNDADYRTNLLGEQKTNYWDESGDKFYDTAVALYPFQYETPSEKTKSQNWLLDAQDNQGCWKGDIRNTAFLLYSVWPRDYNPDTTEVQKDCELDEGGFCMSSISCQDAGGSELYAYSSTCSGLNVCCDKEKTLETCDGLGGKECTGGEVCSTSTTESADISDCCLGYCREITQTATDCEKYGNTCRGSCLDNEDTTVDACGSGQVCCAVKITPSKSYLWIWILLILIVLVLIGIIFRDKLKPFWFRMTSKFGKSGPRGPPPRRGFPPMRTGMPPRGFVPRQPSPRPSLQNNNNARPSPPARSPPQRKSSNELDDVLKKLKEIGK